MGPRFNGVEDLLLGLGIAVLEKASMGPRFNGVEDRFSNSVLRSKASGLQWGHALMAWKTHHAPVGTEASGEASMGPRFNGVEDRGDTLYTPPKGNQLQWGHALMAWKTRQHRPRTVLVPRSFNGATL